MLSTEQLSHLDDAKTNVNDKKMILDVAVDIQSLLRILVEKEIITREEVEEKRNEVRSSAKYKNAYTYIEQTLQEIEIYEKDPQARLREMFNRKTAGN